VTPVLAGIFLLAAAVIAWIVAGPLLAARRRARHRAAPLGEADRMYLRRRVPLYGAMPEDLRRRLEGLVNVFLAEKEFVGCQGLAVSRPMRLAIAAQACLLVLGRDEHVYDLLRSILVYPSQFRVREEWHDEDGVVTEEERTLSGQAWDVSRIVLSWEDVTGRSGGEEAYNVVIHEFAHYLDHEGGGMDGAPALGGREEHARWAATFQAGFDALRAAVDRGEETLLDPYAAEDEAEFFAVASETFFEAPRELARRHPDLYGQLRAYYRLDPAGWAA
jgi:Mlc titration factor MtfA (ptsG expression regulator)